jgi:anaerobic selenocysteine-containing dehydrogenase
MKVSRRSFLSLIIGGAAGTALSPLPFKLMDDSAIWTQMWPWTPVPEDGEVSHVDSICTLCPGGCGITVRKVNDRAIKIEGMKGHPVNDGGICVLGLSGLQLPH